MLVYVDNFHRVYHPHKGGQCECCGSREVSPTLGWPMQVTIFESNNIKDGNGQHYKFLCLVIGPDGKPISGCLKEVANERRG